MCSDKVWRLILIVGFIHSARAAWLRCYRGSLEDFDVTPLEKPFALSNSTCIDRGVPTIIYTFGYRGKVAGPATTAVLGAYLTTKKRNVLLLDWEDEARSGVLGIPLGYMLYAFPNAKQIGNDLGDALVILARSGLNMTHVHLLGHSLGAHIMGYAGRKARENGYVVSRITGLDPARALFEGSFSIQTGLDRTCARFVDIIHSDPGGYGTSTSSGTVDIWPNYSGKGGKQPGCPTGDDYEMFSQEDLCSHDRSWRYLVEAIGTPTSFPAAQASDYPEWLKNGGRSTETIYMGDLASTRARGNFYLNTNPHSPYGRGELGLVPEAYQARRPRNTVLSRMSLLLKYLR